MNPAYLIKKNLDSIHRRWKWLQFGKHLGTAGTAFCLGWFALQLAAWHGILVHKWVFNLFIVFFVWIAILAFLAIGFFVIIRQSKRSWIANALEKGCPGLMDRVNTLVFLEESRRSLQLLPLKRKIEEQAAQVFAQEKAANPFSPEPTLIRLGAFGLALLGVILFQHHFAPFAKLHDREAVAKTAPGPKPESPFELAPHNVTETQEKKAWGEVRIVDPGRDVKLTKIDVLPLQIEMATSDAMQKPVWITSVNGDAEVPHNLDAPSDPNYAVYQPMIYLDQLKVTDWDVVSYYAKVGTCTAASYASKMNFIDIRPFREDILKAMDPKGDGKSKAYNLLSEITGLIKRQTEVLRQTHTHQQTAYANDDLRLQDSRKLADAESDLSVSTDHLFGKIAADSENQSVTEILDQLTAAEQQMNLATNALKDDVVVEGKQREQGALADLVACRKAFQKAVAKGAFGNDGNSDDDDDNIATAKDSQKALSQVSELRDRDKATLGDLHKLVQQQQGLTQTPNSGWTKAQTDVKNNLNKLMQQNPDLFRGSEPEQSAVNEDMSQALDQLNANDAPGAERYITRTGESMGDLEKVVAKNHEAQQLAQAYALKKIIDQNIKQLGQEQTRPGSLSDQDVKTLSNTAQQSTGTLKDITDSMPGSDFGPGLGQALSDQNQQALDDALQKLAQSQPGAGRQGAAGTAQGGLEKISQAFDQSQPELTKQIRGQDQLQPSPGDALNQASQELKSLMMAQQQPMLHSDEEKAENEILQNLQLVQNDPKDKDSPAAMQLMDEAKKLFNRPEPSVDAAALKKLLDQIEAVRIEANDPNAEKPKEEDTTFVDPSKFPPTYRDRIQSYFEQLSTHSQ